MRILQITNESEWDRWGSCWQRLTEANPMASMEWLQSWWRQFGRGHELLILAVEHDDQLVAILPSYRHCSAITPQLRFLGAGSVCSDFLTLFADEEHRESAGEAINKYLFENYLALGLESFQFEGLAHADAWLAQIAPQAQSANFSMRCQQIANAWNLSLPDAWRKLLVSYRGHSVYRKAKKCAKSVETGALNCRELTLPNEIDEGMYQLVRLHQARRTSVGDVGCFADPRFEEFLREAVGRLLGRRKACFTLCESKGQTIGINLLLFGCNRVFMYQSGLDPNYKLLEPGHVALVCSLQSAIARGFADFDFLRGDEAYKAYWGAKPEMLQRVTLASPTLKAQAIEVVHRNLSWLRSRYNDLSGIVSSK